MTIDRITKILSEPTLLENGKTHVVYDIDPIAKNHLLSFTTVTSNSFADTPDAALCFDEITKSHLLGLKNWLFFERGRAPFCTSLNGPHRAHLHLIPKTELSPDTVQLLAKRSYATCYSSSLEALSKLKETTEEYLLFGELGGSCYALTKNKNPTAFLKKRYLRHFLSENAIK